MRNFHTKLKQKVYKRDAYTCQLRLVPGCLGDMKDRYEKWRAGKITRVKAGISVDHIHPTSRGGHWHLENLVTACIPCNKHKGSSVTHTVLL